MSWWVLLWCICHLANSEPHTALCASAKAAFIKLSIQSHCFFFCHYKMSETFWTKQLLCHWKRKKNPQRRKQKWSFRAWLFTSFCAVFLPLSSKTDGKWKQIKFLLTSLSNKEGNTVHDKHFSSLVTAFGSRIAAIESVSDESEFSKFDSVCLPGSTMTPQNSGNGPDGAHLPITRSPMAQERGKSLWFI